MQATSMGLSPSTALASQQGNMAIPGTSLNLTAMRATAVGKLRPDKILNLIVVLQFKAGTDPESYVRSIYDPSSPNYHNFLTPTSFADMFAPSLGEYQSVTNWLTSEGFKVNGTTQPDRLLIQASANVQTIETAFGTNISIYRSSSSTFYSTTGNVQVPANIGNEFRTVLGLHNLTFARIFSGQEKSISGSSDPTYAPTDIRTAYDDSLLVNNLGYTGAGQTIDILDAYAYPNLFSDLNTFDSTYSLPNAPSVLKVSLNSPGACPSGGDACVETALDTEWAHVMAPGANLHVILIPDLTDASLEIGINYVVNTDLTNGGVFSNSWGMVEMCQNALGVKYVCDQSFINAVDPMLLQAASQGISTFFSSGDNGAYGTGKGCFISCETILTVNYPASDPWVTSVGGTSLTSTSGPVESAWSGSGGGISGAFSEPSYQSADFSLSGRGVPDVAADADPSTGVSIYCTDPSCPSGFSTVGGTSLAAPLWAGSTAVLNNAIGHNLGFLNPLIYAIYATSEYSADFHDITTGNNGYYSAGTGWDEVTGLGSPNLFKMAQYRGMTKASVNPTTLTQGQTLSYSGSGFTPGGQVQVIIWNDGSGYIFGPTTATSSGGVSGSLQVIPQILPGQRRVTFTDETTGFVLTEYIQVNELTITASQTQTITPTLTSETTTSTTQTFLTTTTTASTLTSTSTQGQACSTTTTTSPTSTVIQVATTTTQTTTTYTSQTTSVTSTFYTATSSTSTSTTLTTTTTTETLCTSTMTSTTTSISLTTFTRPSTTISLLVNPNTTNLASLVTLSGSIIQSPGPVQVTISASQNSGSTWTTIMIVTTDNSGSYSTGWTPQYPGSYLVEASWSGNNQLAGSTSPAQSLTVTGTPTPTPTLLLSAPSSGSPGQPVQLSITVFNPINSPLNGNVMVEITGPSNYVMFDVVQVNVAAASHATAYYVWTAPNQSGTYTATVNLSPSTPSGVSTATIQIT
jgi:kumamolisin